MGSLPRSLRHSPVAIALTRVMMPQRGPDHPGGLASTAGHLLLQPEKRQEGVAFVPGKAQPGVLPIPCIGRHAALHPGWQKARRTGACAPAQASRQNRAPTPRSATDLRAGYDENLHPMGGAHHLPAARAGPPPQQLW